MDGTLVDSNDAHAHAWVRAIAEAGLTADFATVRQLIGKGGEKLLPEVTGVRTDSARGKNIDKRRGEIFLEQYLPHLRPTPGAKELLARLKRAGLRLAVASSSNDKELDGLLRVCGANEFLEERTSSDDADRSKPDPDIIHAALKRLKLSAGEMLLLGDTPYDVEAAGRAGVKTVAVGCGGWDDASLTGAIRVYDDPADILAHFEQSPFAQG